MRKNTSKEAFETSLLLLSGNVYKRLFSLRRKRSKTKKDKETTQMPPGLTSKPTQMGSYKN